MDVDSTAFSANVLNQNGVATGVQDIITNGESQLPADFKQCYSCLLAGKITGTWPTDAACLTCQTKYCV
jgi:hypothetical protein